MQNALHHAIDLVFILGIAMFGKSITHNSQVIAESFHPILSPLGQGYEREFSPDSVKSLGSLCFTASILAAMAYIAMIATELTVLR